MVRKRIKKCFENDSDDSFDEEKAKAIYTERVFVPPQMSDLETIYEKDSATEESENTEKRPGRRKCFEDASSKMSKEPRRIDNKYWIEDKEKEKKRKLMVSKLFKGRKKIKFQGLNAAQENKFHKILDSLQDSELNLIDENQPKKDTTAKSKMSKKDFVKKAPSRSTRRSRASDKDILQEIQVNEISEQTNQIETSLDQSQTEQTRLEISIEKTSTESLTRSKPNSPFIDPDLIIGDFDDDLAWAPILKTPTQYTTAVKIDNLSGVISTKLRKDRRTSTRRRSSLFGAPPNRSTPKIEQLDKSERSNISSGDLSGLNIACPEVELARQIQGADSIFGPVGFEVEHSDVIGSELAIGRDKESLENDVILTRELSLPTAVKRKAFGRKSMAGQNMKVRRSSRLFHNSNSADVGSVYQEMTFTLRIRSSKSPNVLSKSKSILASADDHT